MRKITDFIIEKRHYILILFIILTIICGYLTNKVNVNYDFAKYLPKDSNTRIGLDIMEEKFKNVETSDLNIMFLDLDKNTQAKIKSELADITNVEEVNFQQKDNYSLYSLLVTGKSDGTKATTVFKTIEEKYQDYTYYTSGNIADVNEPVLPFSIVVLAVCCALVILIIMCNSYVEPFLFLTAILMAVVLNNGTNIIFSNVSFITKSISAILQLALSMDYSIMLMNRYNQEKVSEKDKVKAMKNALHYSFKAISSSSITTIAGLLALVFMSFTIGRDLGLVLAKGVLFSLITIFFVLPSLILMADKLIIKTKKKTPSFNLAWLGKYSYKIRYWAIFIFLFVFIGSAILRGNLGYEYTNSEEDAINKVFTENNQIGIIYNTKEEKNMTEHLSSIEKMPKVTEVLGYGNTINQKLKYNNLNSKLKDLGSDVTIDNYLLKILYFNYFNPQNNIAIKLPNLVNFIETKAYHNPDIDATIDKTTKNNVTRLKNFTNSNLINKKRTIKELASILEIDKNTVNDLIIYYLSINTNNKLTLKEFIDFINKDVITNKKYANKIDNQNLKTISKFLDQEKLKAKINSKEMANLLDLDYDSVNNLYNYYLSLNIVTTDLTIHEFSNFMLNNVVNMPNYQNNFTEDDLNNLNLLNNFSNPEYFQKPLTARDFATIFELDENLIKQLIYLKTQDPTTTTISPYELINFLLTMENIQNYSAIYQKLQKLALIMNSSLKATKYNAEELSPIVNLDQETIKNIFLLYDLENNSPKLSCEEFVNFILEHQNDEKLKNSIDAKMLKDLTFLNNIITSVVNNQKYSAAKMATFLNLNDEDMELLYGLYDAQYIHFNYQLSLKEFINFLKKDVITNKKFQNNFDQNKKTKLTTLQTIIDSCEKGIKYNLNEAYELFRNLASLDKNTLEVLYIYYGSIYEYNDSWQITIEEFIKYLNEEVLKAPKFAAYINDQKRQDIIQAKTTLQDAQEKLLSNTYSRVLINTDLPKEGSKTFAFVQNLKKELNKDMVDFYVIGDSPMAFDIKESFNQELDLITIITMVVIFIVVAVTFKSFLIPIILVLTIQCAVFLTMGILSFIGDDVYFIAILIVQSILMGATIDYAILYTSYYLEHRQTMNVKEALIASYNKSMHAILTSASILIIVTLIVGYFSSAIAAKICTTICEGTICSTILIIFLLPAVLAAWDKIIVHKHK